MIRYSNTTITKVKSFSNRTVEALIRHNFATVPKVLEMFL